MTFNTLQPFAEAPIGPTHQPDTGFESMSHAKAACLPLLVLPPNRLRVLNPVQSPQVMLSLQFARAGHARRCAALAGLMPTAEARQAFNTFMHTLLARRLAVGRIAAAVAQRHAVEDLWRDPLINQCWQRLALRLTPIECERIGRVAADRGLAGSGVRWLSAESATDGWALESSGHVVAQDCRPAVGRSPKPVDGQRNVFAGSGRPRGSLYEPVITQTVIF